MLAAPAPALAQGKAEKIDELMSLYHCFGLFNGSVLVAENGKVIYKKGFGLANMEWEVPNRPDTRFRLGSITKQDRKSTRLNSSHANISYAVFCLKKKK